VKRTALVALLLAAGLGAASPRVKPPWISVLPDQKGRVYALGLAAFAPGEAQALPQAQANARTEVLTRLRASVQAETRVQSQAAFTQQTGGTPTGTSSRSVTQDTRILTQATELPGLVVEETWSDGDERTVYALAYLDVPLAERELRARFQAARRDLAQEAGNPADPRERLRKLQGMRRLQVELATLDDTAALVAAGGGDALLRAEIRDQRLAVDRRLDALRGTLTFCLKGDKGSADIAALVRNAVLQQGLGWSEAEGEFALQLRYSGQRQKIPARWWDYQATGDFIVARGAVEITLVDRLGTEYESTTLEAKGVSVTEFGADRALLKDYRTKLEAALGRWLENLVR